MELVDAINMVNEQDLNNLPIHKLWAIRDALGNGDTPQARKALKKFNTVISPEVFDRVSREQGVIIEQVQEVIQNIRRNKDPLQDSEYQKRFDIFWNTIEIDNADAPETVNKEEYRRQIEQLAELETERSFIEFELEHPGTILKRKPEQQAEFYRNVLSSVLEAKGVEIAASQTFADLLAQKKPDTDQKKEVTKIFNYIINGNAKNKIKVSAQNAINVLGVGMKEAEKFARQLEVFAKVKKFGQNVTKLDNRLKKSYPKTYPFLKNLAVSGSVAVLTGGTGMAVYGFYRLCKTIKTQQEAAARAEKGYWEFLKSDKTQLFALGGAVVTSAASLTGMSLDNMGLLSHLRDGNLAEYVSHMFGNNAAEGTQAAVTLGDRAHGFINAIKANMGNSRYLWRTIAATSTSIAIASYEYAKLARMKAGSAEYKAQKSKAKRALAGSALGTVLGITAAGFGGAVNAEHIDAVTGADRSIDPLGPVTDGPADWKDHMQLSTPLREGWGGLPAEDAAGGVPNAAGAEAVVPSVEDSFFPTQYEADMGITQAQYNNLLKLYSTDDLDRMYMNLSESGIMEHMDGMTKEEFIFKWSKLDAYTDRVRWDENAQQYISIQGAKRYHFEDEMTDLNKMLNCGDKLELAQIEKIKAALGTIDDRGGYHGPGYVPTENYHVKGAGVDGPCSEGQENHFNRGGTAKVPEEKPAPQPEPQPEPAPRPEPKAVPTEPLPVEPVVIEEMKVSYAAEPSAEAVYPSAYSGSNSYPGVDDKGYRIEPIDNGAEGLTAKQVHAPDGYTGLKFTDGDRVRLTVEDSNGVSTQKSRFVNIRDAYSPVDEAAVSQAAAEINGKPEEIIPVTGEDGKTTYQYISNEGVKAVIDPQSQTMRMETLNGAGAPYDIQEKVAGCAVQALNARENGEISVQDFQKPEKSALTPIETKVKGRQIRTVYGRFSSQGR